MKTTDSQCLESRRILKIIKGSHIINWDEGDDSADDDYSFEVVHFANVGYRDSLAVSGNEVEESISDSRYDWLRITMVSHGHDNDGTEWPDKHFGGGNGVEKQLIKLQFKINDVADNFNQKHLEYQLLIMMETTGYYTYVSDDYLLDYKVYIDGNWGTPQKTIELLTEQLVVTLHYIRNLLMLKDIIDISVNQQTDTDFT